MVLLLLGCRAVESGTDSPVEKEDTGSPVETDSAVETDSPTETDSSTETDSPAEGVSAVLAVKPALGDPAGGGERVVVTVDTSTGVTSAALGGVSLTDLRIEDDAHVSGVPGPHDAGVVDVTVNDVVGAGMFEYWSPAQIPDVDLYVDAQKGFSGASWLDQGPKARELTQPDPGRQPTLVDGLLHFVPDQFLRLATASELAGGSSIFAVARWTATTDTVDYASNAPLTIVGDQTNGYGAFGAKGGEIESNHYVGGAALVHRGSGLNDGVLRLIGATYDTGTTTQIYVGNEQQGADDKTAPLLGLNTYDTIGSGYPPADGWDGDLGAVVIVPGVLDQDERTKLDLWAQQRFGTPESPPLDSWTREIVATLPDEWNPRDGAQMVQLATGRILMIGGWSPYDPWDGYRTTNEVWASDDEGLSWFLLLPHDPDAERFPPGHTVGVTTYDGHAVVMGSDCLSPPLEGEVWVESDNGETWTLVTTDAPTTDRCLMMVGNLDDTLYMMGGQTNLYDETTAIADVWRSTDGGVSWEQLETPPWSGRGMVYRPPTLDGKLYVLGGGRYDDTVPVAFNGVYAFDGTTWTTVLPDGHDQWEATYYNAAATLDGRIWLFNGYTGTDELSRGLYSDDQGATWSEYPGGSGGVASHADDVIALEDRILRVSGSLSERDVWGFSP